MDGVLPHEMRLLLARYGEELRLRGFSAKGVLAKRRDAELFLHWAVRTLDVVCVHRVERKALLGYQSHLLSRDSARGGLLCAATVRGMMGHVHGFFRWLRRSGSIHGDPSRDLELPRRSRRVLPRFLEVGEVERLLGDPDPCDPLGSRDLALLELMYSTGLRCGEVCALCFDRLDLKGACLSLAGKGGKEALVPFGEKAGRALAHYLSFGRPRLAVRSGGVRDAIHVFLSHGGRALQANALQDMVRRRGRSCGLDKACHPHLLRHSCATHLLRNGADLRVIQALLRHSDISSTQIYTHVDVEDLKEALGKYHPRERYRG